MKKYFLYCSVSMGSLLLGCKPEVDVSVTNNSGTRIDSILIYAPGINQMLRKPISPGGDTTFVIDFSNVTTSDAILAFSFYLHDGSTKGYSEYLGPPRGHYDIEVLADTVKLKTGKFF